MPLLQCLFCSHVNPGAASFCNECGSQLDLQPCGQCGAVDSRNAKSCYKCGTPFLVPVVPGLDVLRAPAALEHSSDHISRIEASVAGATAMYPHPDQPPTSTDRQLTVGAAAAGMLLQTTRSRSGWLVPGIGLLLVVMAALFAMYYQRPVATPPVQAGEPIAPAMREPSAPPAAPEPSLPPPSPPSPPMQAAPAEPVAAPEEAPVAPAIVTVAPAKAAVRPSPAAAATPAPRPPPTDDAPPITRRARPVIQDCSQALATLGLCNP